MVVDVGASAVTEQPSYTRLLACGLARLIGFEPSEKHFEDLQKNKGPLETYLPYAVGDGKEGTYHLTPHVGFSSMYRMSSWVGSYFGARWGRQRERAVEIPMTTRRLDDIDEIERMDFLKIDIQGGELMVFQNAKRLLSRALDLDALRIVAPISGVLVGFEPNIGDCVQDGALAAKIYAPSEKAVEFFVQIDQLSHSQKLWLSRSGHR